MKKLWKHLALAGLLAASVAGADAMLPATVQANGLESLPQEVQDRGYAIAQAWNRPDEEQEGAAEQDYCIGTTPPDPNDPDEAYVLSIIRDNGDDIPSERSFAGTDWKHFDDGSDTHIVGYYWVLESLPTADLYQKYEGNAYMLNWGSMRDPNDDSKMAWIDPPIIYIDESGKATVTSPGTYGYSHGTGDEVDGYYDPEPSPFQVGQVLWDSMEVRTIDFSAYTDGDEDYYWNPIGHCTTLAIINPHLWYNPRAINEWQALGRKFEYHLGNILWNGDATPVIYSMSSYDNGQYNVELDVGTKTNGLSGYTTLKLRKADWVQYIDNPHYYNQKSY